MTDAIEGGDFKVLESDLNSKNITELSEDIECIVHRYVYLYGCSTDLYSKEIACLKEAIIKICNKFENKVSFDDVLSLFSELSFSDCLYVSEYHMKADVITYMISKLSDFNTVRQDHIHELSKYCTSQSFMNNVTNTLLLDNVETKFKHKPHDYKSLFAY